MYVSEQLINQLLSILRNKFFEMNFINTLRLIYILNMPKGCVFIKARRINFTALLKYFKLVSVYLKLFQTFSLYGLLTAFRYIFFSSVLFVIQINIRFYPYSER